jgi:hypothetical protein
MLFFCCSFELSNKINHYEKQRKKPSSRAAIRRCRNDFQRFNQQTESYCVCKEGDSRFIYLVDEKGCEYFIHPSSLQLEEVGQN